MREAKSVRRVIRKRYVFCVFCCVSGRYGCFYGVVMPGLCCRDGRPCVEWLICSVHKFFFFFV